jgi:hypothetical protein
VGLFLFLCSGFLGGSAPAVCAGGGLQARQGAQVAGQGRPAGEAAAAGLGTWGVAEAGYGALLAGGASAGAHGCRRRSTRGIDRGGWGARAVQLVAHRSKRGSRRQRRGLGDGGVGLGARLPGLVRRRSWGRCVAREEVTGACRRPQGRR